MKVTAPTVKAAVVDGELALPDTFLMCYAIRDPSQLCWPVRIYKVRRTDAQTQTHADRGEAKQAIWALKKAHAGLCRGYGFVVDVDAETVAVPADWNLPSDVTIVNHRVTFDRSLTTNPSDPADQPIIAGILREAIKLRFKNESAEPLGALWQDFDRFCQMPNMSDEGFQFCRKFGATAKVLRGNLWVVQMQVSTATVDDRSFEDYYRDGNVAELAAMIEAKQENRVTRRNRKIGVRVLCDESTEHQPMAKALELDDTSVIASHATLGKHDQQAFSGGTVRCKQFPKGFVDVPMSLVRLILGSQITQGDHSATILEPKERIAFGQMLRDFVDGAKVGDHVIRLEEQPVDTTRFPVVPIAFPRLRVRDGRKGEATLAGIEAVTEDGLKRRARNRSEQIRRNGFLQHRPINPLLAWPERFGFDRARRMQTDLNYVMQSLGIEHRFEPFLYRDAEHLRRHIEQKGFDAVLAVLPEGQAAPHHSNSVHEQIKRLIEVPSQCIQHDHTLPASWVGRKHTEFKAAQPKLANRIRQRYELCVQNLLVKHHWVPFAPADAFAYNVHVGLDVGGQHNNRAMACLGYGFANPTAGLAFRPEEIQIDVQQAEPIPTKCLERGLLQLFETVHAELLATGVRPDFEKVLFFRDGMLLCDGDGVNELDAIKSVFQGLREKGWVSERAVWTAVEVMKLAEDWRVMRGVDGGANPLVGYCVLPFDDDRSGLVCTTGAPYLPQGTASPAKFRIVDVHGRASRTEVVTDLVWEADMCFTKLDIGMSLPWVLHVADAGALQLARSYKITGVTA